MMFPITEGGHMSAKKRLFQLGCQMEGGRDF